MTQQNTIRVRMPAAVEVFLLAEFNQWSTVKTPMQFIGDSIFEVKLPEGVPLGRFCFYVLQSGHSLGKIIRHELDFEPVAG